MKQSERNYDLAKVDLDKPWIVWNFPALSVFHQEKNDIIEGDQIRGYRGCLQFYEFYSDEYCYFKSKNHAQINIKEDWKSWTIRNAPSWDQIVIS